MTTERQKELEKESIDKTYVDNVKKLNDDYIKEEERLTKVYEDEFEKRRNAYYSFAGLFDEVAQRDVTGATLIAALQSQVTAFEDWQKNIASLASKGINEGLLAELQAMGPKAGAEISTLNPTILSEGGVCPLERASGTVERYGPRRTFSLHPEGIYF